jgi:hypothetical protein
MDWFQEAQYRITVDTGVDLRVSFMPRSYLINLATQELCSLLSVVCRRVHEEDSFG